MLHESAVFWLAATLGQIDVSLSFKACIIVEEDSV